MVAEALPSVVCVKAAVVTAAPTAARSTRKAAATRRVGGPARRPVRGAR
jgi:hypothetical protein